MGLSMEIDLKSMRESYGLTQQALADLLCVHINTIQNWESAGSVPNNKYTNLCKALDAYAQSVTKRQERDFEAHLIPLLPVSAMAGHLADYSTAVRPTDCEFGVSPIPGADLIVPISGESMSPEFPNGSRVIVKKCVGNFLEWGKCYLVDTVDGPVLKELHQGDNEDELVCVSRNPDPKYAPFKVYRQDIIGIYRVLMVMSMK